MRRYILIVLLASVIFIITYSCSNTRKPVPAQATSEPARSEVKTYSIPQNKLLQRTADVWVWRSVLDLRSRIISIGLNDKLWVAYNTENASLYKAWTGGLVFDGAVYTTAHGPQPTSIGNSYFSNDSTVAWIVKDNGISSTPSVVYKGHTVLNNQVRLQYELVHQGKHIKVEETPEFFSASGGKVGFERVFKTTDVPEGVEVGLKMHLESITEEDDFATDNRFVVTKSDTQNVSALTYKVADGILYLKNNATTNFSVSITPKPFNDVAKKAPPRVVNEREEKVLALMTKSDCNTCHNRDLKTVGPSFRAIAQRYSNTPKMSAMLIDKVVKGGTGNWGVIPMTPHPLVSKEDVATMVSYILDLDATQENRERSTMPPSDHLFRFNKKASAVKTQSEKPGLALNVYRLEEGFTGFPKIDAKTAPQLSGVANMLHLNNFDFGFNMEEFRGNFALIANGFLNLKKNTNAVFRLVGSDASRLFIDNNLVLENTSGVNSIPKEGEMNNLKAGKHSVRIEYFKKGERGQKRLSLQWRLSDSSSYSAIPPELFTYREVDVKKTKEVEGGPSLPTSPGDGDRLIAVHPSFSLSQARPENFNPKVGGMDFLPDGRLLICTWDSIGGVYILDNVKGGNTQNITVKRIAAGLAEPLGIKVVDNEIYVLQKQELTKLVDLNNDEIIDSYQTICNGWKVSPNFHEFAFGLLYKDGYFYGSLATAIRPGGASMQPQVQDRGKVLKISKANGSFSFIASGLRVPNGVGFGVDNEIFLSDNQGDWLPANKLVHLKEGAWYGSRSVDFEGTANLTEKLPVVYLEVNTIANSPTQPVPLNIGRYKNQMLYGDASYGGIQRVFAEKINGDYQGAVFKFTQGLEAAINRLVWGPDGALYAGGIGSAGNWGQPSQLQYGLQKLTYNNTGAFEMLAIRAKSNGIEIEFTEPLKSSAGTKLSDYRIKQWWIKPTANYGGPNMDEEVLSIKKIVVSPDRKKVLLELPAMKEKHVLYIRLNKKTMISNSNKNLWSTESWYSMNSIPDDSNTKVVKHD